MSDAPYWTSRDGRHVIHHGDCLDVMRTLEAGSVNCCVTSPPYFWLRDYGTAAWEGGDDACDHVQSRGGHLKDSVASTRGGANKVEEAQSLMYRSTCGKCGARRIDAQIGLEPTPAAYVATLVEVFREVWRVLRPDGTVWINLGDSYASGTKGSGGAGKSTLGPKRDLQNIEFQKMTPRKFDAGLADKQLIGIPWRVAFALQADGWYLRQDIIWAKPNPMPESVTDRCTKAHEYVFLLAKSATYHYDAEAISEPAAIHRGAVRDNRESGTGKARGMQGNADRQGNFAPIDGTRNKRSVWHIATHVFPGAHFATTPPALVEPCIKAGCPEGGTVLDPFSGASTVGLVAAQQGRRSVGIELNRDYCDLAVARLEQELAQPTLFADPEPVQAAQQVTMWE